MQDIIAPSKQHHELADGSQIELNTGAHIRLPETFGSTSRKVEVISGEVFFQVTKDEQRAFVVSHAWIDAVVVGTKFQISIDTNASTYTLLVTEGKVRVTPKQSSDDIMVNAGSGIRFHADSRILERLRSIDANATSWHTGVLTFIDQPVTAVIGTLESHYGIDIDLLDSRAGDCLFTAPLPYRDVPVTTILDALSTAYGMTVERSSKGSHILRGGKCR
jgi:ferric-dicitrate binding protein FerR (iron transport regulator)